MLRVRRLPWQDARADDFGSAHGGSVDGCADDICTIDVCAIARADDDARADGRPPSSPGRRQY